MHVLRTSIDGCCILELDTFIDERGSFTRVMEIDPIRALLPGFSVHRVNRSLTRIAGAIRGLHYQREPMAESKVVQCLRGAVYDVCVDLRPGSPTRMQWVGVELSAENQKIMLVPQGCAHGFQALAENAVVEYFVDGSYSPPHESGLRWDDRALAIAWPLACTQTSPRDAAWPLLEHPRAS
jgi:dTDP-4-dehydrorhamnose 3,5-epimerase